eukprot:363053-Chlamydomonas_euryale.AAC.4
MSIPEQRAGELSAATSNPAHSPRPEAARIARAPRWHKILAQIGRLEEAAPRASARRDRDRGWARTGRGSAGRNGKTWKPN